MYGRGPAQDAKSIRVMGKILDYEKPDFVVVNGDLINGDSVPVHNGTRYVDQIVRPMVDRNLTWGSVYGNHDHQPNLNSDALLGRERKFRGARTKKMVNDETAGTTNYYLPVFPSECSDENKCTPDLILWFFDSRGGYYYQQRGPDQRPVHHPNWVDESVVSWFKQQQDAMTTKYQKTIPSLAFVHIPVNTTVIMQTQNGIDPNRQPGINDEVPASPQAQGWCEDGRKTWTTDCKYGGQDVPFIRALAETKGLMGVFSGHDHGNSWCYRWEGQAPGTDISAKGLHLCFGQHTGYGGYGDWIRGSREILVSQDMLKDLAVDSHIRFETGKVVGEVTLNSTFNQDLYPVVPNEKSYWNRN